jgi:hypothetical protein
VRPDDEALEKGSWRLVSTEYGGKPATAPENVVWVFCGDDLIIEALGRAKSKDGDALPVALQRTVQGLGHGAIPFRDGRPFS